MSEENELSLLESLMVEMGDVDLFPDPVLQAYKKNPMKALPLARAAHKAESNPDRKARQAECLARPRLWAAPTRPPSLHTINGFGTTLYGRAFPNREDGTYIATQFIAFLFLPVFPMGSYWVKPADDGGWYFLARTPHPPWVKWPPIAWAAGFFILVAGFSLAGWKAANEADVVVFNGFGEPLEVTAGDRHWTLEPDDHARVTLSTQPTVFTASLLGHAPFETVEIDLTGHSRDTTVYNPGGRGIVTVDYIVYGYGEPPESDLLIGPVHSVRKVDYYFTDPPEQLKVSAGSTVTKRVLDGTGGNPVMIFFALSTRIAPERAMEYADAYVSGGGSDPMLLSVAMGARQEAGATPIEVCAEWAGPTVTDVERHRFCQSARQSVGDATVLGDYRALAESHPDSAPYHYLYGRILPGDDAIAEYDRAIALDPAFARAHLAKGYHLFTHHGDLPAAARSYESALDLDPMLVGDIRPMLLRLARVQGASTTDVLTRTGDSDSATRAALAIEADPSVYAEQRASVASDLASELFDDTSRARLLTPLALVVGDLDEVRSGNADGAGLDVQLALSTRATAADRSAALQVPPETPAQAVLAWDLSTLEGSPEPGYLGMLAGVSSTLPEFLTSHPTATVAEITDALAGVEPSVQAAVWFVYGRRSGNAEMRRNARAWSLPGELPYF
ncbi:MAG: hypothetical protein R3F61_01530 [Myxococcota bacterium]